MSLSHRQLCGLVVTCGLLGCWAILANQASTTFLKEQSDWFVNGDLPSCKGVEGPKSEADKVRWTLLKAVFGLLQAGSVPYFTSSGTTLNLVRDCSMGEADMDIAVVRDWWRIPANKKWLWSALNSTGLEHKLTFGVGPERPSYEEAWTTGGLKLDVFSADEVEPGWWRLPLWIQKAPYGCYIPVEKFVVYKVWGQGVRLPYPFEPMLIKMYGVNYTQSQSWTWHTSPFTTGYCSSNNTLLKVEAGPQD